MSGAMQGGALKLILLILIPVFHGETVVDDDSDDIDLMESIIGNFSTWYSPVEQILSTRQKMSLGMTNMSGLIHNVSAYSANCQIQNNPMDNAAIRTLLLILYVSVFIVAVSGNFLVVYVVMTNKKMQTVTNIFITNLAVSDILVNFTSLWLTPMYTYIGHWIFGGGLCHGLPLFQGTSIFISTLTLTCIAMDRYIVIVRNSATNNINDRMSMKSCVIAIVFIWSISLFLVVPYAINMKLNYIGEPCNFRICSEDWSSERFRTIFGVIVMSLQFVVPFTLIGISYSCIWNFLNNRESMVERRGETARKKRVLRMLIIMVLIFAICWFPFNLLNVLRDLKMDSFMKSYFSFAFLVVHLISMTATCWNPILYAWMNESFREEFAKVVPFLRRADIACSRRVREASDSTRTKTTIAKIPKSSNIEQTVLTDVHPSSEPKGSIVYLDQADTRSSSQSLIL